MRHLFACIVLPSSANNIAAPWCRGLLAIFAILKPNYKHKKRNILLRYLRICLQEFAFCYNLSLFTIFTYSIPFDVEFVWVVCVWPPPHTFCQSAEEIKKSHIIELRRLKQHKIVKKWIWWCCFFLVFSTVEHFFTASLLKAAHGFSP